MKARGPLPRTSEQRRARRLVRERCRATLRGEILCDVVDALESARPALVTESKRVRRGIAHVVMCAHMRQRRHKQHPGYFSLHHEQLETLFGRGAFTRINERHRLFDVRECAKAGHTRAYKLVPTIERAVRSHLQAGNDAGRIASLVCLSGKKRRSLPPVIQRSSLRGTRSPWTNALPVGLVPISDALAALDLHLRELELLNERKRARPCRRLGVKSNEELDRLIGFIARLRSKARTDIAGRSVLFHEYRQGRSGRLFAVGINLQSAPKLIRRAALHGLYAYDFANAHPTIFYQLARRAGTELGALAHYLGNKEAVRDGIARRIGLTKAEAKLCLIRLGYGARRSRRPDDSIPRLVGAERATRLFADPVVTALANDMRVGRNAILRHWPQQRGRLRNDMGLTYRPKLTRSGRSKDTRATRLAHILQGVEAKMLHLVIRRFADDIVLLEHDGWTARRRLDTGEIERLIRAETGFSMKLEESTIESVAPPVINRAIAPVQRLAVALVNASARWPAS